MIQPGPSSRHASAALVLVALTACLYDPDDVCGPNQEQSELNVCECVAGTVPASAGCAMCGDNEVPAGSVCACVDGYARPADGEPCAPLPAGLGEACDSGAAPCADATYSLCRTTDGTSGYCTSSGCETSDDCPAQYACTDDGDTRYCKRPPTGQGLPCQSADDCAGYEASYCETYQAHVCLVSDCTVSPNSCHEGSECCDLSSLGLAETLCVEEGLCPTG